MYLPYMYPPSGMWSNGTIVIDVGFNLKIGFCLGLL